MRSLILILATAGVLVGVFIFYAMMQSPPPESPDAPREAATPEPKFSFKQRPAAEIPKSDNGATTNPSAQAPSPSTPQNAAENENPRIIGAGENVWVKAFDKNNQLINEFRAEHYDPKGNDVTVTRPQARFYLGEGEILLIEAERGRIVVPASSGQRETLRDSRSQTPTRGELFEVTLSLLKSLDATDPIFRCTMNNVSFDNDTFTIATDAFVDPTGRTIPANEVPIQVRGIDYDFDGYGLVIRWNEIDRRLDTLQMSRGDRLVVKNPAALQLDKATAGVGAPAEPRAAEPIVVTWTGPLKIAPGKTSKSLDRQHYRGMLTDNVRVMEAQNELASGDMLEISFSVEKDSKAATADERPVVVSLSGAPAVIKMQGLSARAGVVTYDTTTGSATLRSSAEFPQLGLQDAAGRTMLARQIDFDRKTGVATLLGPAKFELPLPADGADSKAVRMLVADAAKQCIVELDTSGEQYAVKMARLEGDVAIDHPQLKLNCQTLAMAFDPVAAEPTMQSLQADGGVRATLVDERGVPQKIECATLRLKARNGAGGKIGAQSLHAEGNVKIDSTTQQIAAGKLDVEFEPRRGEAAGSTNFLAVGDEQVRSMLAESSVQLRGADGAAITAERISYNAIPAAPRDRLRVEGAPATIGDERGTLSASLIDFDPMSGAARVVGGGRFNTTFASDADRPGAPVLVIWQGDLAFDPNTNSAAINDGVAIESDQTDGVRVRGSAKSLVLSFDAASGGDSSGTPISGRQIRDVTLLGSVQFAALQNDLAGGLSQRMHLFCEKLAYRPTDGQILVPVGGRMLVEDRRPAAEPRSTGQTTSPRGATAFQWADQLTFLPAKNEAQMAGDVLVVHRPSNEGARDLRLNADTVTAELLPSGGLAPTTQRIGATAQLKRVNATGNVRFTSEKLEFLAADVELRPQDDLLIARGAPGVPATLVDQEGMSKGSFSELWLNTKSQESHLKDFRASVRRGN